MLDLLEPVRAFAQALRVIVVGPHFQDHRRIRTRGIPIVLEQRALGLIFQIRNDPIDTRLGIGVVRLGGQQCPIVAQRVVELRFDDAPGRKRDLGLLE